jgi:branched-chain amino acid transport system permease protein
MRFSGPINLARWIIWLGAIVLAAVLPLFFTQSFAITFMSQIGTFIIFALSFNMLLGQGGMLSFGHAVYSGLGAFFAIHALNLISKGSIVFPVSLLPLIGGVAGMGFGVLFGYVTTKKAGTTFSMISLGIGEMVAACSLMFPGFFGGEGGITTNRVVGQSFLGITYGPGIEVYYLIAVWALLCTAAMYAFTQTPLGRMANAVRDNPERAEFVGYDTQTVRFLTLVLSSFFAGVAGALTAINFEIVSAENVGAIRSAGVLMATFIGGAGFFFGPIIGSVIFMFFVVALSAYTNAWQFYLGLFFVLMVMYAPGGIASLLMMHLQVLKNGLFKRLLPSYAVAGVAALLLMLALVGTVEMIYHISSDGPAETVMTLAGQPVQPKAVSSWLVVVLLAVAGAAVFAAARQRVKAAWSAIHLELKQGRA